jgi:dodecin
MNMIHIAKIVELIDSSARVGDKAVQVALDEAKKTIHGIIGIQLT